MKHLILFVSVVFIVGCEQSPTYSGQRNVSVNNTLDYPVYISSVGLQTSYRIDVAPFIPLDSGHLTEIKSGKELDLQTVVSYAEEKGICLFVYRLTDSDNRMHPGLGYFYSNAVQVPYTELQKNNVIILK